MCLMTALIFIHAASGACYRLWGKVRLFQKSHPIFAERHELCICGFAWETKGKAFVLFRKVCFGFCLRYQTGSDREKTGKLMG